MRIFTFLGLITALILPLEALAQTTSSYQNGGGSLILPKAKPKASVILMGGGHGRLSIMGEGEVTSLLGNQLIRTRNAYARQGFAVLALDSGSSLSRAIGEMRKIAQPVVVVGTSRAATRASAGVAADGIVLTSAMLDQFQSSVGSSSSLPPTLIIHHKQDGCRVSLPSLVDPFIRWSEGRARVIWVTGGHDEGDPCQADGYHGFAGQDGKIVSLVSTFVRQTKVRQ